VTDPKAEPEPAAWRTWVLWIGVLGASTALMAGIRSYLNEAHVALAYLLLILGASAHRGRALGLTLTVLAFLLFDYLFLLPYGTLTVAARVDWFVLVAFLVTSFVAAQLFERARGKADIARELAAKDAVVAAMSHDLRTPLTTIKAMAHDIAATGDDRAVTIEEEADRLNTLVTDMLDLSRLNAGIASLTIGPNEAEDLIGAALQRVAGRATGREIRVTLDPAHPLLFGRFDFAQTLRIVVNLLENALKYSRPTDAVELRARRDGVALVLSVADRGDGVAQSERERIFEPFYRRPGAAADSGGAGLGLSISRALAAAQGGTLTHEPRDGGGSVFTLRLPAMDVEDVADA